MVDTSVPSPARMRRNMPSQKVMASSAAAAIATLLIWVLDTYVLEAPMPAPIQGALTTLVVLVMGYLAPPSRNDLAA